MDMTRPSTGNDQTEDPIKINHTEEVEEEHHESGATKMFKKVKARAKKIKTSLTKHGNDQEEDDDEDDDEDDGKDSPTRLPEEESETTPAAKEVPAKESEYGLGRDLPVEASSTRDEPKPITYTEMIGSATTFVTDKAVATKNVVASSLGYSGGDPVGSAEYPANATGTVDEKLSNDDKIGSSTKLPLSGGGSVAEETKQVDDKGVSARDYMVEKLKPGEDDKALSEMITEKLQLGRRGEEKKITKDVEVASEKIPSDKTSEENKDGDVVGEEEKGGVGMVGKIKGVYNYWVGGTTEEVKPKSPVSVDETSQSLGSTVGTKGFSDSGENGLGTTGGSTGVVPLHKGL